MKALFKQFEEYLHAVSVSDTSASFTFLPFDLIDKDLDMDELSYIEHLAAFRRYLDALIRERRTPYLTEETFMLSRNTMDPFKRGIQYAPLEGGRMLKTTIEAVDGGN